MRNAGRARLALLSLLLVIAVAAVATPGAGARAGLDMYRTTVDGATLADLRDRGYDIASVKADGAKLRVDLVLSARERASLSGRDVRVRVLRDRQGRTVAQRAKAQARGGFTVYHDYDGPDGIRAELYRFARQHRSIARLHVLGHTLEGREILAVELTQGGRGQGKHAKPAVLYQGTTHAREWISTEVTRRLMQLVRRSLVDRQGVKRLLQDPRAVVRPGRQPRRLPVHVRRRAAVAQEPARQQRGRRDHARRRRRPQPQLPRALELRRRGLEDGHVGRRPTAARPPPRSRRPGPT